MNVDFVQAVVRIEDARYRAGQAVWSIPWSKVFMWLCVWVLFPILLGFMVVMFHGALIQRDPPAADMWKTLVVWQVVGRIPGWWSRLVTRCRMVLIRADRIAHDLERK